MRLLTLPAILLALAACGEPDRTQTILGLTGDAVDGETLYGNSCAGCHGADATGGDGYPDLTATTIGDEAIVDIILYGSGTMPEYESLDDQDVANLLAFINGL